MPSLWLLLPFGLLVLAGIAIWSIRTHRDPHLRLECDYSIDKLVPSLSGLTLGTPVGGNSVCCDREASVTHQRGKATRASSGES